MPPKLKPNAMDEEMEVIKTTLNRLSDEIDKVSKQQTKLIELMGEVKNLKATIKEKDMKITDLEKRVENLEQYTRMEDLVISGLETKHQTYARVAAASNKGEDAPENELQTLEQQVIKFFQSKTMSIASSNISACHSLPRKDSKSKPVIIVRFANRKSKIELLRQGKKLAGTGVYLNEHLTKKNSEIAREARILRKQSKIQATWTRNCKVLIRLNGSSPESAKVVTVKELNELDKYR